ncbi:hypothetical protein Micbo1qcDRAFT_201480 [Microdochium bolleyi]|uniref:Uncharacterized protein n=1 Tax=Microdochium bolleyi TaxID=196109 RepID=A0A136JG76_9PEZI|nr:hypothetical protein Micbo1qcDRAFT_201480 [Microdochium bolleyi]
MAPRAVYLAKSGPASKRRHFGILIPNANCDRATLSSDYKDITQSPTALGTIIHVVGEPLMAGFAHEFKRNFDCATDPALRALVFLGHVDDSDVFELDQKSQIIEDVPRGALEKLAVSVPPPPKGQDIRALVDGVKTRRCQEWTLEYLALLVKHGKISEDAVAIAQAERDPPSYGIFGMNELEERSGLQSTFIED